jgi:hypothetical protein
LKADSRYNWNIVKSGVKHHNSNPPQTKEIKLVFVVSPLSMQHIGIKAKSGCLGIVIMCTGGITCVWPLTVVPVT